MNSIQDILRLVPLAKSRAGSERAVLIEDFVKRLNQGAKQYKPSFIAWKLSHIKLEDLYWFYKKCDNSENFNMCFFGLLKTK